MVLAFKEIDLEGQNGEELIDIALDILDAVLFPCPDFRGDVIIDGYVCLGFYKLRYLQIKAWIVDEDDAIRLPGYNIILAHLHIPQYRRQMKKYRNETHIGEVAIVANAGSAHRLHQVATKESELRIGVKILQRLHQMRSMEVA